MFRKANLRLTILYSLLFLVSFWIFSFGTYLWMRDSLGSEYLNEVQQQSGPEFSENETSVATIAGDVALGRLWNILVVLNGGLLVIVPAAAWFLTRRTLAPVQRAHNQQRQFVSDAAHELRTPLSIMAGEIEVTLNQERSAAEYKQVLASGKEEADRLIDLAENLLFLARGDQGRQTPQLEKIDLTDLIGSVISNLQSESSNKHISLSFETEAEPTFAWGQEPMLRRLFFNLIHNAILYTPSPGSVHVSLSSNKQYSLVEVKDTGIGISPEDHEKIFDRFYRVDTSRSRTRGYGLGLAISKSIVELHHGKITVHSALGKGSTFTVMIPKMKS